MDFITSLLVSTNWKDKTYDSILVIIDRLTKIVHYEPIKITINVFDLAKVIINMVMQDHGLPNFIVNNQDSIFTFKFCSSLYYFLGIKQRLSTAFYP